MGGRRAWDADSAGSIPASPTMELTQLAWDTVLKTVARREAARRFDSCRFRIEGV